MKNSDKKDILEIGPNSYYLKNKIQFEGSDLGGHYKNFGYD